MNKQYLIMFFVLTGYLAPAQPYYNKQQIKELSYKAQKAYRRTGRFLDGAAKGEFIYRPPARSGIDTLFFASDSLLIRFKDEFAYKPLRPAHVADIQEQLGKKLHGLARRNHVQVTVKGYPLERLVPNRYLNEKDSLRLSANNQERPVHVQNISRPYSVISGLNNRHLALWNSHGWYYQNKLDRWGWQRATLFTTVEDVLTTSFVLPFVVPMLEQAGANVYLPRERDTQVNEVISDNRDSSYTEEPDRNLFITGQGKAYGHGKPPWQSEQNPFQQGDYRILHLQPGSKGRVTWTPAIPCDGEYAVYVAYQTLTESDDQAHYEVRHTGGITHFIVNQQVGGGTWVYLGTFHFQAGKNKEQGSVTLLTNGSKEKVLTADAVRFGGGMGSIARNGNTSGRPRWTEAARYYLQYAGFPDTLVFNQQEDKNDYVDDYRSRGRWVNYMLGGRYMEPWVTKGKNIQGLQIPIDLSLAFHTDAGHHTGTDKLVGTLAIYSSRDVEFNQRFPDGEDRLTNRDFADLLSTQITDDIRAGMNKTWPQRELWDQRYSEATYPTVPSALLELLSHQNLGDMQYALDPEFRFLVSRAIYKSILKFLAEYHQCSYVVQPLPVNRFQARLHEGRAKLSWQPVSDPPEPSAEPEQYVVYTRKEDQGWDNGVLTDTTEFLSPPLEKGTIYSFKITAVNQGGESFPSNVLAICDNGPNAETVIIIDAFDRVSAPKVINEGNFTGFAGWIDEGVAWGNDLSTIGQEYEFNQMKPWKDDDDPGHGATYDHRAGMLALGNNFDHVYTHGVSIRNAGYSFVSCSRQSIEQGDLTLDRYLLTDLIFGEEKTTVSPSGTIKYVLYTPALRSALLHFLQTPRAGLLISGAYVGSDPFTTNERNVTDEEKEFVKKILGYTGRTDHASATPLVKATDGSPVPAFDGTFGFNMDYRPDLYRVESPDAIIPADSTGMTIVRYQGNNKSAGVIFNKGYKVITMGFPFETVTNREKQTAVMKQILDCLSQ
ncbi:MAG: fibronectin type III domain-containing protein [Prolixibacteraceae bacterium]